ncbi:MAG: PIN domain-containing protein [Caldimonas sp.]
MVLDTNVVLDWLLFDDPRCAALTEAIGTGRVRWLASTEMRDELEDVLTRGIAPKRKRDPAAVLAQWDRWAVIAEPGDQPSPRELRCSDGDDQKFIDLALQVRAAALISRDRAVLKLARRAALHGLTIVSIADWKPARPA